MYEKIKQETKQALEELIEVSGIGDGDVLVVGCSSSEVAGGIIGHDSSLQTAEAVFEAIYPVLKEKGIFLAAQCCV